MIYPVEHALLFSHSLRSNVMLDFFTPKLLWFKIKAASMESDRLQNFPDLLKLRV